MAVEPTGFSIVIATHNRPAKLRSLLESIRSAGNPSLESIIVVDDSNSFEDLDKEFSDVNLHHIRLQHRVFQSRARNIGWRANQSACVYFIDDDNVVTESTLKEPLRLLFERSDLGAVMPAVLYKQSPELVWVYATPLKADGWGHILVGRNCQRSPSFEDRLLPTDALPNAFVVRRVALEQLNGFDERFVMSGSADFAIRLKQSGWNVCAYTGAFTFHDVEPPGQMGYWASHRAMDPERVFHDVRDWFALMRFLHADDDWFVLRATIHALGFMLPNGLAYLLRGGAQGRQSLKQLALAYVSSIKTDGARIKT